MLLARIGDTPYRLVLLLHILTAIIGFGAVFLNALYGRAAERRKGAEGLAIAETNFDVSQMAGYFVYAVPVLGILLVLMSDKFYEFSQIWISVTFVLYIVALGLSHGVLRPNVKKMHALMRELVAMGAPAPGGAAGRPPQVDEIEQRARTVGTTGAVLNVILVVILYLMVWKPGL
jgi:TRAP-type uncharacterized transport system fused permease subunit